MKAKIHALATTVSASLAITIQATANSDEPTYTDPKKVDSDYAVQGEYSGVIGGKKSGAQVIALGEGKFDLVVYPGGLPGDGWDGNKENRLKASGTTKDGTTTLQSDALAGSLTDGELTLTKPAGLYERIIRKSPTLGKKPPAGAVVLFDGKNVDAWNKGAKMGDGLLHQGATSTEKFGDFSLHFEFRTPYKPRARGQKRGNSGFYAQARYEVQVLDSFGLEGKQNECGGIYSTKAPRINMCYPPLTWQTYDVDFVAAKFDAQGKKIANAHMTVRHNGVLIHDKTVCDHRTTASPLEEGPEPGPIYLQSHSNPVRYRNIWVMPKK